MIIRDLDSNLIARSSDEREEIVKMFIQLNPKLDTDDWLINTLYNNMYNNDFIKMFGNQYFDTYDEMVDFFYKFVYYSRVKLSRNCEINQIPRLIEMLWDGINGWQW